MLNTFDVHLVDLRRRIRDYAAGVPPQYQKQADANGEFVAVTITNVRI